MLNRDVGWIYNNYQINKQDTGSRLLFNQSHLVDGSMLVDHSSIGVDMSGNNNNFYDQNFGVGDSKPPLANTYQ